MSLNITSSPSAPALTPQQIAAQNNAITAQTLARTVDDARMIFSTVKSRNEAAYERLNPADAVLSAQRWATLGTNGVHFMQASILAFQFCAQAAALDGGTYAPLALPAGRSLQPNSDGSVSVLLNGAIVSPSAS